MILPDTGDSGAFSSIFLASAFFLLPSGFDARPVPQCPLGRKPLNRRYSNPITGVKMEWEIRIHNEENYIEVITKGVADKDSSLNMAKTIKETMQQHRITKALIDHRKIEGVSGEIIEIYDRPKLLRIIGLVLGIKIAEIIKPVHMKHFSFFETVCINQGFRISIFQEKLPALEWLLK